MRTNTRISPLTIQEQQRLETILPNLLSISRHLQKQFPKYPLDEVHSEVEFSALILSKHSCSYDPDQYSLYVSRRARWLLIDKIRAQTRLRSTDTQGPCLCFRPPDSYIFDQRQPPDTQSDDLSEYLLPCNQLQKKILYYEFCESYTTQEIAEQLGLHIRKVQRLRKDALDSLRARCQLSLTASPTAE
jgi:hypothetical protein